MQKDPQSLIDIADSIGLIFEYLQPTTWSQFATNLGDFSIRKYRIFFSPYVGKAALKELGEMP